MPHHIEQQSLQILYNILLQFAYKHTIARTELNNFFSFAFTTNSAVDIIVMSVSCNRK